MKAALAQTEPCCLCLECAYDLRGLPRGKCPECGREFDPKDARTIATESMQLRAGKLAGQTRRALIVMLAIGAIMLSVLSILCVDPLLIGVGTFVASIGLIPTVVVWLVAELRSRHPSPKAIIMNLALIVVSVSIVVLQWPIAFAFAMHQSAFERLVTQVNAGNTPAVPQRIGLYVIRGVEIRPQGAVWLQTDLDANGPSGFYFTNTPVNTPPINAWSAARLSRLWWYVVED